MKLIRKLLNTGFFHIFTSGVVNKIISFMSSIVLVRILSVNEYGIYTYAWNIYTMMSIVTGFGLDAACLQLASERNQDKEYVNGVFRFGTRVGSGLNLLLSIIILFVALYGDFKLEGADEIMKISCCLPIFTWIYQQINTYLRTQKDNRHYAYSTNINTVLLFLCSVFGAIWLREKGLILGTYIATIISIVVGLFWISFSSIKKYTKKISVEEKKLLFQIAVTTLFATGISQLIYNVDIFLIGIVVPDEAILANYKVALQIPNALLFIPRSLIVYVYPYFAEHRMDGRWCIKNYKKIMCLTGIFNLLITIAMIIFAEIIIRIIYSENYLGCISVFRLLAVDYFVSGTFRILAGNLLVTQRKLKINIWAVSISAIVNIVGDLFLVPHMGSEGAAITTIFVDGLIGAICTIVLLMSFRKNIKD